MLTAQSNTKFTAARKRALIEEWISYFKGQPTELLPFELVKERLKLSSSTYRGLQEIEIDKIVGSTGRYRDFTRTFLPKQTQTEGRWRQLHAVSQNIGFPPIEVYQVGQVYFVSDGNHRISVSRMNKARFIEAYVIEYQTDVVIEKEDDLNDVLLKAERQAFFSETQLDQLRPDFRFELTEPGSYPLIQEHINFHKFLKETEYHTEITMEQAVTSWFDTVFVPIVALIERQNIMSDFPKRTVGDLYVWLGKHRAELEGQANMLSPLPDEVILRDFAKEKGGLLNRVTQFLRKRLKQENLPLEMEQARFFAETRLHEIRPERRLRFTELGSYRLAKEQIDFHKYLKESEYSRELTYQEAVTSWYDAVYLPLAYLVHQHNLLTHFPKNTEGDLCLWLFLHRAMLEKENNRLGEITLEELIEDLKTRIGTTPLNWLSRFFNKHQFVPKRLQLKLERMEFFQRTKLDETRVTNNIFFNELDGYRLLDEHITFHKYLKETERNQPLSFEMAATSWYDTVYLPVVALIHEHHVPMFFPEHTEAEFYLWFVLQRASREQALNGLGGVDDKVVIKEMKRETSLTPLHGIYAFGARF